MVDIRECTGGQEPYFRSRIRLLLTGAGADGSFFTNRSSGG